MGNYDQNTAVSSKQIILNLDIYGYCYNVIATICIEMAMSKSMKNIIALCAGVALSGSIAANAASTFTNHDGVLLASCKLDSSSSIDFCSKKSTDKIKSIAKIQPNFGKNSVLMRFWDKEMNYWTYLAYNKTSKKAHFYPRGLSSFLGEPRDVKVTFSNNLLCTSGDDVSVTGDINNKAFTDTDNDIDYCTKYTEDTGFLENYIIDSKSRKVLREFGI